MTLPVDLLLVPAMVAFCTMGVPPAVVPAIVGAAFPYIVGAITHDKRSARRWVRSRQPFGDSASGLLASPDGLHVGEQEAYAIAT